MEPGSRRPGGREHGYQNVLGVILTPRGPSPRCPQSLAPVSDSSRVKAHGPSSSLSSQWDLQLTSSLPEVKKQEQNKLPSPGLCTPPSARYIPQCCNMEGDPQSQHSLYECPRYTSDHGRAQPLLPPAPRCPIPLSHLPRGPVTPSLLPTPEHQLLSTGNCDSRPPLPSRGQLVREHRCPALLLATAIRPRWRFRDQKQVPGRPLRAQ